MTDETRPRELLKVSLQIMRAAYPSADAQMTCNRAVGFVLWLAKEDRPHWTQDFGCGITGWILNTRTSGEIRVDGRTLIYSKQARNMAEALTRAGAWEEALKDLGRFHWIERHARALLDHVECMTHQEVLAWAEQGSDA